MVLSDTDIMTKVTKKNNNARGKLEAKMGKDAILQVSCVESSWYIFNRGQSVEGTSVHMHAHMSSLTSFAALLVVSLDCSKEFGDCYCSFSSTPSSTG